MIRRRPDSRSIGASADNPAKAGFHGVFRWHRAFAPPYAFYSRSGAGRFWTLLIACCILTGTAGFVWAQDEPRSERQIRQPSEPPIGSPLLPLPERPPLQASPGTEDPYWSETVQRALRNAESPSAEVRRSAVMLLGKYPVPQAEAAVVRALEDDEALVRQAALVSLFETQRIYTGQTAVRIARRVGDPDVGIRRIASNVLPMVVQGFPLTISPRERQPVRDIPPELREIFLDAFRDEDATVRRNMIRHYRHLYLPLPEDLMAELVRDPDREVAIEALDVASSQFSAEFLARQAVDLVNHPDRIFRLNLARNLGDSGHPGAREALDVLRSDEDPEIALEAFLGYFRQSPDVETYEVLWDAIQERGAPREMARRAIEATLFLGTRAESFLRRWMEHEDAVLRYEAARVYFPRFPESVRDEEVRALLGEESQQSRGVALRFLRQYPQRVSAELLQQAAESRWADVRTGAVELTRFTDRSAGEEILRELLLDPDPGVRAAVLRQMPERRMEDWERVLRLSLSDRDPGIRNTALQGLMHHVTPRTLGALRDFLEDNPESPLRPSIEQHLARHEGRL